MQKQRQEEILQLREERQRQEEIQHLRDEREQQLQQREFLQQQLNIKNTVKRKNLWLYLCIVILIILNVKLEFLF